MKKILIALFLITLPAHADTAWLTCKVFDKENKSLTEISSKTPYDCWENCSINHYDEKNKFILDAQFHNQISHNTEIPAQINIGLNDTFLHVYSSSTTTIEPALQTCSDAELITDRLDVKCQYCQQD